jgi:hypothetical protein
MEALLLSSFALRAFYNRSETTGRDLLQNLKRIASVLMIVSFCSCSAPPVRARSHAESRATPNGNAYTRFSLATRVSWKENGNEYKPRTEWHRIICWNKLAE